MSREVRVEAVEPRRLMAVSVSVNFQPLRANRAPGLLTEYGVEYGVRRGGVSYGFDRNLTANAVERNLTKVQKNDTFISMPTGSQWEVGVPNGKYVVYVVAGDPAVSGERMAITAEGQSVIAGTTRASKPYLEGGVTVDVTDGRVTVASAGIWGKDKINYLAVVSADGVAPTTPNTPAAVTTNTIKWVSGARELTPRTEPESAVVGDKLYVFSGYGDKTGGVDGWEPSRTYERYDPATGKWAMMGQMPTPTTHSAVAVAGTDVWFAGGYTLRPTDPNKQDVTSTNVWVYHTTTNTWEKGPALPARRASGGMGVINNVLYYTSGEPQDHHSNSTDTWALDLANKAAGWKAKAAIPNGRTHFGTAVVNNKLYVLGGQHDIDAKATFLKDAYSYDPTADKWTRLADIPSIRSHLSPNTFVIGTKIYAIGGEWKFNYELNNVLVYDTATNKAIDLATPIPALRAAGAAGFVGGKIVFTGGKNNGFFSDTYIGTFI